jgi:hypothetical protein
MRINLFQHVFQKIEHIIVPESDYTYAHGLKNFRSFFVIQALFFMVMPTSIELNSKTGIMAVEIQDISAYRILSAKLEAAETACSQKMPQQFFCVSLFLTKLFGKNEQLWWYRQRCPLTLALSLRERELLCCCNGRLDLYMLLHYKHASQKE